MSLEAFITHFVCVIIGGMVGITLMCVFTKQERRDLEIELKERDAR